MVLVVAPPGPVSSEELVMVRNIEEYAWRAAHTEPSGARNVYGFDSRRDACVWCERAVELFGGSGVVYPGYEVVYAGPGDCEVWYG